mmetsp:Transcript_24628/g.49921  ORF Transcript_24628/g.49921 Transcript_24628/m.49921 type:complete len:122 (+) Transcript_24628:70-435(+)
MRAYQVLARQNSRMSTSIACIATATQQLQHSKHCKHCKHRTHTQHMQRAHNTTKIAGTSTGTGITSTVSMQQAQQHSNNSPIKPQGPRHCDIATSTSVCHHSLLHPKTSGFPELLSLAEFR